MEWPGGTRIRGLGRGTATREGMLIAGADAALEALTRITGDSLTLEYRGAKVVRAFDALVIIVALRAHAPERRYDLIGACTAPEDDVVRGVVLGVLDATNRILGLYAEDAEEKADEPRTSGQSPGDDGPRMSLDGC
jgi:hypothetical protein